MRVEIPSIPLQPAVGVRMTPETALENNAPLPKSPDAAVMDNSPLPKNSVTY